MFKLQTFELCITIIDDEMMIADAGVLSKYIFPANAVTCGGAFMHRRYSQQSMLLSDYYFNCV